MLSHALRAKVQNSTIPTVSDPNFKQVSLLLHGDGTNGAQNNTFLDSSTNNFTVTRNGSTTQGTNTPFSQAAGYWSNYLSGSNGGLRTLSGSQFNLSTNNFTAECWFYPSVASTVDLFSIVSAGTGGYAAVRLLFRSTDFQLLVSSNGGSWAIVLTCNATIPLNAWHHIACVRNGNTFTVYFNGVSIGSSTTANALYYDSTKTTFVGSYDAFTNTLNGYISNARLVNGTAVYTANFTPPTTPLTAITNTALLTCQSNNFKDNSSNNAALTAGSTNAVQPFSPFAPTAAYSTSVNGGSIYFDGTGDYLSVVNTSALAFGTGDFTVELWLYLNSTSNAAYIHGSTNSTGNFGFNLVSGTMLVYTVGGGAVSYSPSLSTNQWTHLAFTRSGTTLTLYKNGVSLGTRSFTNNVTAASGSTVIGSETGSTNFVNGYMADLRMVKGTAVYTANFTPPTAPLTAITNTSLLLSGTNAGIFDNAIKNDLETVGNAQVSTSVTKFGTGSMKFDSGGGGGYLIIPTSNNFTFGTGNFTIEFWVYSNSTQSALFYDSRPLSTNGIYPTLYTNADNTVRLFVNSVDVITSSAVLTNNTWHHVAVCRSGTATKLFINGTQSGSTYTDTNNYLNGANRPVIGTQGVTLGASVLNGYIDDLRVTNGIARYTANFTPPTAAFPNQ